MAITIQKRGDIYVALCPFSEKDKVKAAGFRWNQPYAPRCWSTKSEAIAQKFMDPEAYKAKLAASRAEDSDAILPCPEGLAYLPYQRAGIAFALTHNSVLFGDEMGLGKTIQALGVINSDESIKSVLIICPNSLKLNWAKELKKWLTREMSIGIVYGNLIPAATDITIVNYDLMDRHADFFQARRYDLLIADEAHYLKNPKAKRTKAVVGSESKDKKTPGIKARRRLLLTGTPIPNRPIEAYPLVHFLAPDTFGSFFQFAMRYANAHQNRYGWDFSGSSNLEELQEKLRATVMVRRLKADVLTELPAKRRSIIELPTNGAQKAVDEEREAYERNEDEIATLQAQVELSKADSEEAYQEAVGKLRDRVRAAFAEISALRHQTAVAKIPAMVEHLTNSIEDGSKVVFFAHHHDVLKAIQQAFPQSVMVYGETPVKERDKAVERFQNDPSVKLFIGGILAAGVGLTLTAASHVVFGELDWVPGNVTQAEDRCHRIGQKDMVLVEHLVLDGSLDARMAKTLVEKQEVIDRALDREAAEIPAAPSVEHVTVSKKELETPTYAAEVIEAAHDAMKRLAAMDADFAFFINGKGFSKIDGKIGHSLAGREVLTARQAVIAVKLAKKYRRQLPAELLEVING